MMPYLADFALAAAVAIPVILLGGHLSRRTANDTAASAIEGTAFGLAYGWSTWVPSLLRGQPADFAATSTGVLMGLLLFIQGLATRRGQTLSRARLPILTLYGVVGAFVLVGIANWIAPGR